MIAEEDELERNKQLLELRASVLEAEEERHLIREGIR